ncbi:hypothetical protein C0993_006494 [Termitomyces sp. T159_Od127]|nr:hypothetical protein C0993_006494 [Termitomyces sp. T159_Od127]
MYPLLFTAGMTLVDSADSILMLYSYIGFPERGWVLLEKNPPSMPEVQEKDIHEKALEEAPPGPRNEIKTSGGAPVPVYRDEEAALPAPARDAAFARDTAVKMHVMSGLSVILTIMSVLVAFSISLITIMGLIGERCGRCSRAAEAEDGGGLEGSWWRAWARANSSSGYIGVGIIGSFLVIVAGWYVMRRVLRKKLGAA